MISQIWAAVVGAVGALGTCVVECLQHLTKGGM